MKWIVSFLMVLGLVGCGPIGCKGKPPYRATLDENGRYGMRYHAVIYTISESGGLNPHNLSTSCKEYEYIPEHIYFDEFGTMNAEQVVWKNYMREDIPFSENGEIRSNVILNISTNAIGINGFKDNYLNQTYSIDTTSPESWGVPIFQGY